MCLRYKLVIIENNNYNSKKVCYTLYEVTTKERKQTKADSKMQQKKSWNNSNKCTNASLDWKICRFLFNMI